MTPRIINIHTTNSQISMEFSSCHMLGIVLILKLRYRTNCWSDMQENFDIMIVDQCVSIIIDHEC